MPVGDFAIDVRSSRSRPPSRSFSVLDGNSGAGQSGKGRGNGKKLAHVEDGTPLGYGSSYEAYVSYKKDRWCTHTCLCLHHAAASNQVDLVEAAARGLLPYSRLHGLTEADDAGRTPAMVAAWRGSVEALRFLVEDGTDLCARDKRGRTVFHWAALSPRAYQVLSLLCGRNADPKVKDALGDTCLHAVIKFGDVKSAELLCRHYPQLCVIKNQLGQLPQDMCQHKPDMRVVVSVDQGKRYVQIEQERLCQLAEQLDKHLKEKRDLRDDWAAFADLHEASSSTSLLTSLEEVRSSSFKNTEENGEQSPGSDSMPYKTLFQTEA
ncbi:hypothetical protein GUITHDRAFT_139235 [Guillardia theta CCMP2712]|uniref:Uncharacterized protein n=1 Tax=Guillardia theta (strain CCMP2712) TaxID=905079 RepID=L1J8U5_GUITC|nr:hypothetical protein GUITHDRAFT_139235 [Guillardia theta CCMP2712]EKX44941.1 hypothetical protein GUITHDRAFT_139235 [Guillardia theta CCMP2712]|eukprot:XP_005831921.1 hypothetical protein GUITHDRAFT_139235 [Guillardia theta CCMP2712]